MIFLIALSIVVLILTVLLYKALTKMENYRQAYEEEVKVTDAQEKEISRLKRDLTGLIRNQNSMKKQAKRWKRDSEKVNK